MSWTPRSKICSNKPFHRLATGRPRKIDEIVPTLLEFAKVHNFESDARRRTVTTRAEGFRLIDALQPLVENVPGLYASGMSRQSVAREFHPPRRGTHAAKTYHAAVDVRVGSKRNDARKLTHDTHWARSGMTLAGMDCLSWADR